MAYEYTNESVTFDPPIIFTRWEVRNSSGTVISQLEDTGQVDFTFAFPYLDTFRVTLTVRDVGLNEDSETKEYVYDQFPDCVPGGGGGAPSGPAMAEKYADEKPAGKVTVTDISTAELKGKCNCEKLIKVIKIRQATLNEFTQEDMNFTISLRDKLERMENKNKEIEEKTKELINLVHNPDEDLKPKKK